MKYSLEATKETLGRHRDGRFSVNDEELAFQKITGRKESDGNRDF